MNYIYALFAFECILFVVAFIASKKDIMAPSVIMCVMFLISTFFALLNVKTWNIQYGIKSFLILALGLSVFVIAENVVRVFCRGNTSMDSSANNKKFQAFHVQTWKIIALAVFNFGVLLWYYSEIYRIVSAYKMDTSSLFASYRYINIQYMLPEDSKIPMINTILSQLIKVTTASAYIALYILIHNLFANIKYIRSVKCWGLIFVLAQYCAVVLFGGGRNGILQLAACAVIEIYIIWHQKYGWSRAATVKFVLIGAACVLVGIPLFYLAQVVVGRTTDRSLFEQTSIYIGSSIALFDMFIKQPAAPPTVFGEETLLGVHEFLKRLRVATTVKNIHLERRYFDGAGHLSSNIYTFFRRPLHDFGLVGMCIFTMLVAAFFAWLYYKKIKWHDGDRHIHYGVLLYGYLFFWVIYTSIDQRSAIYLSMSTFLQLLAIFIGFFIITRVNLIVEDGRPKVKITSGYDEESFGQM